MEQQNEEDAHDMLCWVVATRPYPEKTVGDSNGIATSHLVFLSEEDAHSVLAATIELYGPHYRVFPAKLTVYGKDKRP